MIPQQFKTYLRLFFITVILFSSQSSLTQITRSSVLKACPIKMQNMIVSRRLNSAKCLNAAKHFDDGPMNTKRKSSHQQSTVIRATHQNALHNGVEWSWCSLFLTIFVSLIIKIIRSLIMTLNLSMKRRSIKNNGAWCTKTKDSAEEKPVLWYRRQLTDATARRTVQNMIPCWKNEYRTKRKSEELVGIINPGKAEWPWNSTGEYRSFQPRQE